MARELRSLEVDASNRLFLATVDDTLVRAVALAIVSGFLQRMCRTGRRPGTTRNRLFLATRNDTLFLLRAAALIELWSTG